MNNIYFEILEFVILSKKLEFLLREQFQFSGESIFRGYYDKLIPRIGEIIHNNEKFEFKFHGIGIDFKSKQRLLRYTGGKYGLGVFFTPEIIIGYNRDTFEEIEREFVRLVESNLLMQWMPEMPLSKVYYLV
ncbi:MAG TPA: hypothetical protein PKD32_11420 [Saprospiraceae bacterium]|nr:hypothetical protein [Saprospiraceae bacterium]